MDACEVTDFMFPMKADIYFPIVAQGGYGQPTKNWVYDRTITCNATSGFFLDILKLYYYLNFFLCNI